MNIIVQGGIKSPIPGAQCIIDPTRGAGRFSIAPFDHSDGQGNLLGHYRVSATGIGLTAAAAGCTIVACQYTDRHSVMVPMKISLGVALTVANGTATGALTAALYAARNYVTAQAGGTALVPFAATNSQKNRANMAAPLLTDLRMSAASNLTITGASWVLDSYPLSTVGYNISIIGAAGLADKQDLYKYDAFGSHPLVFGAYEGWAIQLPGGLNNGTQAATWYLTYEWAELAQF